IPCDSSSSISASRTRWSSSTTKTMWLSVDMGRRYDDRQGEDEDGALGLVLLHPQPPAMGFDDGAANGQAQAHSIFLRRVEGVEDPRGELNAAAAIADLGPDHIPRPAHADPQRPVAHGRVHRIHAIADEIDENLLDLHAIEGEGREIVFDV